ncbi:MAG: thioredoxin domain-containing protein [Acidiferrobacterales bacterium]
MPNPNNLLGQETSPYLLQHADNPVDWHAWNPASLAKAKSENKPILLSIGYSACHWCHVMAHESFEEKSTAEIMNKYFINIKVDREERPDLDKIYQTAHSLLTSRAGGWPLTVFLSPENQIPFFAGTYFPDKPRHNMPTFTEIMELVADAWQNKLDAIKKQESAITNALTNISSHTGLNTDLNAAPLDLAYQQLVNAFDHENGGFSGAPKFPHSEMLERCLRQHLLVKSRDKNTSRALDMACLTLDKMALGGFRDQIGGGFYRYSTDKFWMIPHFEKMLYDNGQLLTLYGQAWLVTNNNLYKQVIESTADWLMRDMQTDEGGYCAALDADTGHVEGKTYVWIPEQIEDLLSEDEFNVYKVKYGLTGPANFEGHWHMHSTILNHELAKDLNIKEEQIELLIASANKKLLDQRNTRPQPGRDDKILCAWNALAIRGMGFAGRCTGNQQYVDSAIKSADFIYNTLWKKQRLLVSYKDGKAHLNAYLDDYAYLLQALLELLQSQWSNRYYEWVLQLADNLLDNFEDKENGGFFFTSHDHEHLIYRSKTFSDDAMPNGNAVAASALLQLGLLSGRTQYLDAAERCLRCGFNALAEQAIAHCSLSHALELYLNPGLVVILRGNKERLQEWQQITNHRFIPRLTCFAIETGASVPKIFEHKKPVGEICAYICEGTHCLPVITNFSDYKDYLNEL